MKLLASWLEADGPQLSYCHDDAQFVPEMIHTNKIPAT